MSMNELIKVSRHYGADPDFVLGGGGNTSWKNEKRLFVKASGIALSTIDEDGFVALDLAEVRRILTLGFPADAQARETQVLASLMSARVEGQTMRPSVETILHTLFPYAYVVHTHPALVNGLLCAVDSKRETEKLFGSRALWIPYTTPGYVLSKTLSDAFLALEKSGKEIPHIVFLQNHGVFVAADTVAEIDTLYASIFAAIGGAISGRPDFSEAGSNPDNSERRVWSEAIAAMSPGASIVFSANREILRFVGSKAAFKPLDGAFSPDHIVYAGAVPLFVGRQGSFGKALGAEKENAAPLVEGAWKSFLERERFAPRIVAVEKIGVFALGKTEKAAGLSLELFLDAVKIAHYAASFGGFRHLDHDNVEFIKKWEVEQYRASIAAKQQ